MLFNSPQSRCKLLGVIKLKMILGVEGVEPPDWGQRPQTPPSQLIVATYLVRSHNYVRPATSYDVTECNQDLYEIDRSSPDNL
jgi:hypothetical protein